MNDYVTPKKARKMLNVNNDTLIKWSDSNKLETIKTPGGHRRYNLKSIKESQKNKNDFIIINSKINYCYARVSSAGQKEDLERQLVLFRNRYPKHVIIKDIGSGINFKRKGFKTLLDAGIQGNIEEIVITHKDRLCRFGFELIEGIVREYSNGKIVVLNKEECSRERELVDDIVSIITVFSSRLYGLRSHGIKKEIQNLKNKDVSNKNGS